MLDTIPSGNRGASWAALLDRPRGDGRRASRLGGECVPCHWSIQSLIVIPLWTRLRQREQKRGQRRSSAGCSPHCRRTDEGWVRMAQLESGSIGDQVVSRFALEGLMKAWARRCPGSEVRYHARCCRLHSDSACHRFAVFSPLWNSFLTGGRAKSLGHSLFLRRRMGKCAVLRRAYQGLRSASVRSWCSRREGKATSCSSKWDELGGIAILELRNRRALHSSRDKFGCLGACPWQLREWTGMVD